MKQYAQKAFTLVELLIVIGIIGLLAVTVLLTLNPAEAQKRTRDTKRISDAQKIQAILEQYVNDGVAVQGAWTTAITAAGAGTTSVGAGNAQSQPCATNWLGVNVCAYASSMPTDPSNNQRRTCTNSSGTAVNNCLMFYYVRFSGTNVAPGSDYEIGVRQEATSNASKLSGDGGDASEWFEIFTSGTGTQVMVGNPS